MAPVRSFCPARFARGLLLLAGVIAAATKGSASGWIWLLQPVGVNVHAGSTREAMSWVNPAPPPAPETKFVLTASAELGTAAIGWQFGDRLGVALGTQLGSAGVVSLMKGASDRFLTYLPLMGYTMLRLGEGGTSHNRCCRSEHAMVRVYVTTKDPVAASRSTCAINGIGGARRWSSVYVTRTTFSACRSLTVSSGTPCSQLD